MKILKDLSGESFGYWTVIKKSGKLNGNIAYLCKCKCGKEKIINNTALRKGITKSCGCLRREKRLKNIIGLKFGKLLVIKNNGYINRRATWLCKCDCGNKKIVFGHSLISGGTKSCGCLKLGHKPWNKGIKGYMTAWNRGKKMSKETCIKMSVSKQGEKHVAWKGKDAGYGAKHDYIRRIKGTAIKCKECGKENKKIHWSNIDHKYSRNPDDYIALCASCHKLYDLNNNLCKH